jgi:Zn-dependent M28 family amino/carboxypeptidase
MMQHRSGQVGWRWGWLSGVGLVVTVLLLLPGLFGCRRPAFGPRHFDGELAYQHVLAQMEFGPRHPGSEGGRQVGDYIAAELQEQGWEVQEQSFEFAGVPIRNIVGVRGEGPAVLFGAHYDTRRWADLDPDPARREDPVPGANDGASGVAVLLELARVLGQEDLDMEVRLAFFDAEDQGNIGGWPWSVGASYMAKNYAVEEFPVYVVVVDMIGDADQQLYWEQNSQQELSEAIWTLAAELGYNDVFTPTHRYRIIDDHLPFGRRKIPSVDIIDFDYPFWHTVSDTADKVSPESLERVGRVVEEMVRRRIWVTEAVSP